MRTSTNLHLCSVLLLLLTTFTAAWPWPRWLPEIDSLIVRQENNQNSNSASASATRTGSASASPTDDNDSSSGSGRATATGSDGDSKSGSQTGSTTAGSTKKSKSGSSAATVTKHTAYDVSYPAGGVNLQTPAIISGSQFYKVGDFVTFGWNLTSLQATPTAVNVMATCVANAQLYTLAANQTVTNGTGMVVWDTGAYQATAISAPLLTQTYTLIIYDAESSISATAEAGYLQVFNQYSFGMYTPQPYVPLNEFKCATCSAALGDTEMRALGMVFGMGVLTVLSFTWFVNGLGVVW